MAHCIRYFTCGSGAKYCDQSLSLSLSVCVCVCVCPRAYLPNHTCRLYQIFFAFCLLPWLGPPLAGCRYTKGKGQFSEENVAPHCKVMGHSTVSCAKTAEPIEMPFWMKTQVGPRNHVIDGAADPQGEGAIFGSCPVHSKALAIFAAAVLRKGSLNRQ